MPLVANGKAPYAPAPAILAVVEGFRERGLQTPITKDVLERTGVKATVVPLTLRSLRLLDLIDEEGQPTSEFREFQTAPHDEAPERFAAMLRSTYAVVFQFADPAQDPPQRVRDAFRTFEPRRQQARMVTLFYALCDYAGIIETVPQDARGAINRTLKERGSGNGKPRTERTKASSRGGKPQDDFKGQQDPPPPPPPPPPASSARERYLALLLKKAEEGDPDPDLFDRIERVLGVPPASPPKPGGGND